MEQALELGLLQAGELHRALAILADLLRLLLRLGGLAERARGALVVRPGAPLGELDLAPRRVDPRLRVLHGLGPGAERDQQQA